MVTKFFETVDELLRLPFRIVEKVLSWKSFTTVLGELKMSQTGRSLEVSRRAMLSKTKIPAALALLVHHTDAIREWAYDRDSKVGKLDKALDAAPAEGWTVISMKDDWKKIFQFGSK